MWLSIFKCDCSEESRACGVNNAVRGKGNLYLSEYSPYSTCSTSVVTSRKIPNESFVLYLAEHLSQEQLDICKKVQQQNPWPVIYDHLYIWSVENTMSVPSIEIIQKFQSAMFSKLFWKDVSELKKLFE